MFSKDDTAIYAYIYIHICIYIYMSLYMCDVCAHEGEILSNILSSCLHSRGHLKLELKKQRLEIF